jgi:hypothetical protein
MQVDKGDLRLADMMRMESGERASGRKHEARHHILRCDGRACQLEARDWDETILWGARIQILGEDGISLSMRGNASRRVFSLLFSHPKEQMRRRNSRAQPPAAGY